MAAADVLSGSSGLSAVGVARPVGTSEGPCSESFSALAAHFKKYDPCRIVDGASKSAGLRPTVRRRAMQQSLYIYL